MRYNLVYIATNFLMISILNFPVCSFISAPLRKNLGKNGLNTMRKSQTRCFNSLLGGDFGGLSGTFNSKTGKLVRVPEHLVPSSMVEWGQIPSALEVITSEERQGGELQRWTVFVMPEVGCGIDNLDTMKKEERWKNSGKDDWKTTFLEEETSNHLNKKRIEVCFPLHSDDPNVLQCRIRVGLEIMETKNNLYELGSLISIVHERKNDDKNSGGKIADGGGLDARTVFHLVGKENTNKPFTEQTPQISDNILNGIWSKSNELSLEYWNDSNFRTLYLPGNIIVRYDDKSSGVDEIETAISPFLDLEISLFENQQNENGSLELKRTCWKGKYIQGSFENLNSWEEYKTGKQS